MPQGSPLGPLCYIVLISDLSPSLPNIKYVNDVTVYEIFCSPGESQLDEASLQLNDWSSINGAQISSKKTKEILFSCNRNNLTDINNATPTALVNSNHIERVNSCCLLGLYIDKNLSWQIHVKTIISKCNIHLHFLRRLKRAGYKITELKLYFTACLRSIVEYGCQLWSTSLTEDQISALEDIKNLSLSHHYWHITTGLRNAIPKSDVKILQNRFFIKSLIRRHVSTIYYPLLEILI